LFSFRFCAVHPKDVRDFQLRQLFEVPDKDIPTFYHAYSVNRGGDQDLLFIFRSPDSVRVFRSRRDGKVLTALIVDLHTKQITAIDPSEAQKGLNAEIAYWDYAFKTPANSK
jgi:hypothetical protein